MNLHRLGLAVALACAAPLPSLAQQLQQPTVPTTQPPAPSRPSVVGPQLNQPPPPAQVATDPQQRPQTSAIPSVGPGKTVTPGGTLPAAKAKPARVLDATGRPLNGMVQVAPNRVYDPATKRYHWTDGSAEQQTLLKD